MRKPMKTFNQEQLPQCSFCVAHLQRYVQINLTCSVSFLVLSHYFDSYSGICSAFQELLIFFRLVGHILKMRIFQSFLRGISACFLRLSSTPFQYSSLPSCSSVRGLDPVSAFFYNWGGRRSIFRIYVHCLLPAFTRPSSRYFVTFWLLFCSPKTKELSI